VRSYLLSRGRLGIVRYQGKPKSRKDMPISRGGGEGRGTSPSYMWEAPISSDAKGEKIGQGEGKVLLILISYRGKEGGKKKCARFSGKCAVVRLESEGKGTKGIGEGEKGHQSICV